jgi:hypothetical protein
VCGRVADAQGIEVTDCFSLPPPESLDNRVLEKYCDDWYALHSKVYSKEQIVGWYISCDDDEPILEWSSQLHEVFARRCERNGIQAVHLVVDTATEKSEMGVEAFVANRVRLGPGMDIATAYHQIQVNLVASDSEKICMQHLVEGVGEDAEEMLKATEPLSQGFQRPAMLQTRLPDSHEALTGAIQVNSSNCSSRASLHQFPHHSHVCDLFDFGFAAIVDSGEQRARLRERRRGGQATARCGDRGCARRCNGRDYTTGYAVVGVVLRLEATGPAHGGVPDVADTDPSVDRGEAQRDYLSLPPPSTFSSRRLCVCSSKVYRSKNSTRRPVFASSQMIKTVISYS